MSHEDVLLMVKAIDGIAGACGIIAAVLLACTALKIFTDRR